MSVTSVTVTVFVAMVVLVVVVGFLETRTPAPRPKATSVTRPRLVKGSVASLPVLDLVGERRAHDRRLASLTAGDEPAPYEPATEAVPVVVLTGWLAEDKVAGEAREVLMAIARSRPAPIDATVVGREIARELELEIAAEIEDISFERGAVEPEVIELETVELEVIELEGVDLQAVGADLAAETAADVAARARPALLPERRSSPVAVATVDRPGGTVVDLGPTGTDRDLVGVVFAAYVAGGFPEYSRVTGWVAPNGDPPSLPALATGTTLRGRPARVAELLGCTDDDRNWVTLQPSVDIERGLKHRKPGCEVLKGLLWWWMAATDERARVPADHIGELRHGLEAVAPHMGGNPLAATVDELRAAVAEAEAAGVGLRVESMSSTTIDARRDGSAADSSGIDGSGADSTGVELVNAVGTDGSGGGSAAPRDLLASA